MKITISNNLADWLANGERGISSEKMAEVFSGLPARTLTASGGLFSNYPHDPSDFERCYKFLEACPEFKPRLSEMKAIHPVWANMVDHWGEMESLYLEERASGKAPKLYALMTQLRGISERQFS